MSSIVPTHEAARENSSPMGEAGWGCHTRFVATLPQPLQAREGRTALSASPAPLFRAEIGRRFTCVQVLIAFLLGCTLLGCGHAPIRHGDLSSIPPNALERSAEVRVPLTASMEADRAAEDNYLCVTGYGRLPEGSLGQTQDWLRAKRAAIDDAYAKLVTEAVKEDDVRPGRQTGAINGSRNTQSRGVSSGAVGQAEIVSIKRLPDGSCQVLMRAPISQIKANPEAKAPPPESSK